MFRMTCERFGYIVDCATREIAEVAAAGQTGLCPGPHTIEEVDEDSTGPAATQDDQRGNSVKTKAEAVREELRHGKSEGLLPDLVRAVPSLSVERLERLADGWSSTDDEIDTLFDALGLDEDSLEEDEDPEAASERDGVRSWVVEYVDGVEGPSLSLSMTPKSSGTRIAGPKPWGGGAVTKTWSVDPQDIFEALGFKGDEAAAMARAVEGLRKISEEKYPALYPTS